MTALSVLERLRGGLIVSVQPEAGSPLANAQTVALLSKVAERNGAAGLRIEGVASLQAVRAASMLPIVGILKRAHSGFSPYITSSRAEVAEVAAAGAEIVAFDATLRPRVDGSSVGDLVRAAHDAGCLAMADCATIDEGRAAFAAGSDLVATTLAGYTDDTRGRSLPALDVVAALREEGFVVCEGGIASPEDARGAFAAGASAIVVGTAITNVDALVRRFAQARDASP